MPPSTYTCPECEANLRPTKPFPPGKKVKCPKCGAVFAIPSDPQPARARQSASSPKAAAAPPPKSIDPTEDEGMATYAFKEEQASNEKFEAEKKRAVLGIVLDRAPKSKRGPAMATIVMPSNILLATGLINCLMQLFCICVWIWPIIFSEHILQPKDVLTNAENKPIDKEWKDLAGDEKVRMKDEERKDIWIRIGLVGASVVSFAYAGVIAYGAVRMQNLEAYGLAIITSIMAIFPWGAAWAACLLYWVWFTFLPLGAALLTIPAGLWALITLRNSDLMEGYFEKPKY